MDIAIQLRVRRHLALESDDNKIKRVKFLSFFRVLNIRQELRIAYRRKSAFE
jgi:hypothetical protein